MNSRYEAFRHLSNARFALMARAREQQSRVLAILLTALVMGYPWYSLVADGLGGVAVRAGVFAPAILMMSTVSVLLITWAVAVHVLDRASAFRPVTAAQQGTGRVRAVLRRYPPAQAVVEYAQRRGRKIHMLDLYEMERRARAAGVYDTPFDI